MLLLIVVTNRYNRNSKIFIFLFDHVMCNTERTAEKLSTLSQKNTQISIKSWTLFPHLTPFTHGRKTIKNILCMYLNNSQFNCGACNKHFLVQYFQNDSCDIKTQRKRYPYLYKSMTHTPGFIQMLVAHDRIFSIDLCNRCDYDYNIPKQPDPTSKNIVLSL